MSGSRSNRFKQSATLSVVVLHFALFAACSSTAPDHKTAIKSDKAAIELLARVDRSISQDRSISPNDLEELKALHKQYPDAVSVRKSLKNALVVRTDWDSLEEILTDRPVGELPTDERVMLGTLYAKIGEYGKAVEVLEPLSVTNPNDLELHSRLALAYFHLDRANEAGAAIDRVWDKIVAERMYDEMTLRGLIYLRQENLPKALEVLKGSYAINPDHIATNNALTRIYARLGDAQQAEQHRIRTVEGQNELVDSKYKASQQVKKIYDLEDAWNEKNYVRVIAIAQEMVPATNREQKIVLLQYVHESYKALGNTRAAEAAADELKKLTTKP
jgi:Flp pilus assembly protein TadD